MLKILIVIPAYNEEENIERVVNDLKNNFSQYDYIIVNDGSKDKTAEICANKGYRALNLPINLGLAGAFQAGVKYAALHNYDAVLQFDADGQHCAKYIPEMEQKIANGCDIVIGSRFVDNAKPFTARMLGSRLISAAVRLTTGKKLTDPTSGMRMYNKAMIAEFANSSNHGPEPDTISYLMRCGARVEEVQVEMLERTAGESYLNFSRSIFYMLRMTISILLVQWVRAKKRKNK